jgi:uncharacterized membrane protein YeaQ/YmgE (transglycosylase-associated protein family)
MVMDTQLNLLGTPGMGFFSLIIIGGLAGWIAGMFTGMRHGLLTNILVGIAGSWVGAELSQLAGIYVRGTVGHLIAAIIGSVVVLYVWQMLHSQTTQRL